MTLLLYDMGYGTLGYDAVRYVGVCLRPKIGTRRVPTVTV